MSVIDLRAYSTSMQITELRQKGDTAWAEAETIFQVIAQLNRRLDQLKAEAFQSWAKADAMEENQ